MDYMHEYEKWLASPFLSDEEKNELRSLSRNEIYERFCAPLSFGTSGLRGITGTGLNRMNVFTLCQAVRALAAYLDGKGPVIVCRDARLKSSELAEAAASVLAEAGIKVLYFKDPRPTPELSFAVSRYGAAGINVTASHNPPEYNGCKFYSGIGAQMDKDETASLFSLFGRFPILSEKPAGFDTFVKKGQISYIDCDEEYIEDVLENRVDESLLKKTPLSVVYTPFSGVGGSITPRVFERAGVKSFFCEKKSMVPDGTFPGLKSPNPENHGGFKRAVALAREKGADIVIGTDPDADRMAACVRHSGRYRFLSGNQVGALLTYYLITAKKRLRKLPENACVIKTIVSTPLTDRICEHYGVFCHSTFTGFKNMAAKLREVEDRETCLMCFEESIGYMIGTSVRDKDGISASLLLCEAAAYYLKKGQTLFDALSEIYSRFGRMHDHSLSVTYPGADGMKKMKAVMDSLRSSPPSSLGGEEIADVLDYLSGGKTEISGENVLEFRLRRGGRLLIRPSGTEPKIKIYAHTEGRSASALSNALKEYITSEGKNGR